MATLILRPIADVQLNHSKSSGSNGYSLISEATADGESSYIYYEIAKNKTGSATSVFKVSGSSSNKIRISSLRLNINAKVNNDFDSASLAYNLYFNGVEGASGSNDLSKSFANYGKTYSAADFGFADTIFDSFDAANLQVHILTSLDADKNNALRAYVTQMYLEVTYDEVSTTYTCSAIAGGNVASASVSRAIVTPGETVTFTATLNPGCSFDGWYTSASGGTKVSGNEIYTTTINASTTLYARATKDTYNISAVASGHCSASVNRSTAQYGDSAIFTATLDTGYDFDGWYTASSGGTKVSGNNPYTHTVTGNTTLYARAVLHIFAINLDAGNTDTNHYGERERDSSNLNSGEKTLANMTIYAVAVKWDAMSASDINNFNNGNFSAISSTAKSDYQTAAIKRYSSSYSYWAPKLTINVPYGYTLGLYATSGNALQTSSSTTIYSEGVKYYWSTSNANNSVTGTGLTSNTWNAGFENYTTKNFIAANDVGVTRIDNVTANSSYYYNSFAYHDNQLNATYGISSVSADAAHSCTIDTVGIHATVQDSRFFFKEWRIGSKNGTAVGANSANYTVPANHHNYLTIDTSAPYTADMVMYAIADTNQTKWYPTAYGDTGVTASVSQDWIVANDNYTVRYSAIVAEHYEWFGWYRDASGTDLVSTDLIIDYIPSSADQGVLYAKASPIIYSITLEQADGGLATATPSMGMYGTNSTLRWEDSLGWYDFNYWAKLENVSPDYMDADAHNRVNSSGELSPLTVSTSPTYWNGPGDYHEDLDSLCISDTTYRLQLNNKYSVLFDGVFYTNLEPYSCNYTKSFSSGSPIVCKVAIGGPDKGYPFGFYSPESTSRSMVIAVTGDKSTKHYFGIFTNYNVVDGWVEISNTNPYDYVIKDNTSIKPFVSEKPWYYCTVDGEYTNLISISAVQGHVVAGDEVTFSYNGGSAYAFMGWYSDEECTQLVSEEENYTFIPESNIVLYAKIQQVSTSTGIYIKQNGGYIVAKAVYKKENGSWVEQTDYTSIFNTDDRYRIRQ